MRVVYLENKTEDKKRLNDFLLSMKHGQFMQSWEWGEFQKLLGKEVVRVGIENEEGQLIMVATMVKIKLPVRKSYYYISRGPIFMNWTKEVGDMFFDEMRDLCRKNDAIFLRFESGFIMNEMKYPVVSTIGPLPDFSIIIDISRPEENIFDSMSRDTRENIRIAYKEKITIKEGSTKDFDDFWNLMIKTQNRDNFLPHIKDYFEKLMDIDFIKLFILKHNSKTVAAGLFSFWGDTATYLHGASEDDYDSSVFPHALQWHVIREAKRRSYKYYDLYGIDEIRWPGITKFKSGFDGEKIEHPGVNDVVFSEQWYGIYQFAKMIRKWFN